MKKIIALILSLVMAFSLTACGNNSSDNSSESGSQNSYDSSQSASESNKNVEIINNTDDDTLEITIEPALLYKIFDELKDELEDNEKSISTIMENVQINKDGSVTVKFPKHYQEKMLREIKDELYDMFPSDDFKSIKKIEFNEDITDVKIYVDRQSFEKGMGELAVIGIATMAHTYHLVEKQPEKTVIIHYIDNQTNEEFDSYSSLNNKIIKK